MATPTLRERHVDRMFAEECESSPSFAAWFASLALGARAPSARSLTCRATINHHREFGETDILLAVAWASGDTAQIHVEDKVGCGPGPEQAARYARAVAAVNCQLAACVLIAPSAWMRRHPKESAIYDARVSFEEIAQQLETRAETVARRDDDLAAELASRLRWRARVFGGDTARQAAKAAIADGDLEAWNEDAAEVIYAFNGLRPKESPRSPGCRPSRFFQFDEDLSPGPDGRPPRLQLKTLGENKPGRVSLDIRAAGEDHKLVDNARAEGFTVNTHQPKGDGKAPTLLVEATGPRLAQLTISSPVKDQVDGLEEAAAQAQKLLEWWARQTSA